MKNNTIVRDTMILTVITLVAGLLLGLVYEITKAPIAEQKAIAKQEAYEAVFADATFEPLYEGENAELQSYLAENGYASQTIDEIMIAKDASGAEVGYVMSVTTPEGYGGDITFSMGVQSDGTLNGISILSIAETPGLGMNADSDSFKGQFADKNVESFVVTKTGASADNEIDALSGATITSNAMTGGVNAGLCAVQYVKGGN